MDNLGAIDLGSLGMALEEQATYSSQVLGTRLRQMRRLFESWGHHRSQLALKTKRELESIFRRHDREKNGTLSRADFVKTVQELDPALSDGQADGVIDN